MSATRDYEFICDICFQESWIDEMVVVDGWRTCELCREEIDGDEVSELRPDNDRASP